MHECTWFAKHFFVGSKGDIDNLRVMSNDLELGLLGQVHDLVFGEAIREVRHFLLLVVVVVVLSNPFFFLLCCLFVLFLFAADTFLLVVLVLVPIEVAGRHGGAARTQHVHIEITIHVGGVHE